MKKTMPSRIPKFKNDEEIAAFMEKYSAFDLVDAGLADIIPTPLFVRAQQEGKTLLKDKRIQVGRDEKDDCINEIDAKNAARPRGLGRASMTEYPKK